MCVCACVCPRIHAVLCACIWTPACASETGGLCACMHTCSGVFVHMTRGAEEGIGQQRRAVSKFSFAPRSDKSDTQTREG